MQAPTAEDLLNEVVVQQALEKAWTDSIPNDSLRQHEEGGWIYLDTATGSVVVRRASAGTQTTLDLSMPPVVPGARVRMGVERGDHHGAEGWEPGPSTEDTQSAWLLGVPCLIRADDGIHTTGPDSRRGGLTGGIGYPP